MCTYDMSMISLLVCVGLRFVAGGRAYATVLRLSSVCRLSSSSVPNVLWLNGAS